MKKSQMKKYLPLIRIIKVLPQEQKKELIPFLCNDAVESLSGAVKNVIANDSISEDTRKMMKKKLLPHKKDLRYIANKCKGVACRKKKLSQLGGNILGVIASIILPLLSNLFSRKN